MAPAVFLAFTVPIPPWLESGFAFVGNHIVYWVISLALVYEIRYLASRERFRHIAMFGWGGASRAERPFFYGLLWLFHLIVTTVFGLGVLSYAAEQAAKL
jgi:hypothetical protein